MPKRRFRFTYEGELVKDPVIYQLGHKFRIVTNVRMADVDKDFGWVVLELEGDEDEIDRALVWVKEQGVRVDPVPGDVLEG